MAEVVEWLRSQIVAEKEAAEAATKGAWDCDDGGSIHVGHPTNVVVDWIPDERDLDHVLRQQPRDTVARCEADLLLLDDHSPIPYSADCPRCLVEVVIVDEGSEYGYEVRKYETAPCRVLRVLAYGRRHRPGWHPDWAPEGMTP